MYLLDLVWYVACLNLINHLFVLFRKTTKYVVNLIFMFNSLAKQGNVIKAGCKPLNILIDGLSSFRPLIRLLFELLHMGAARFSVSGGKCARDLRGGARSGEHGLDRDGDCT